MSCIYMYIHVHYDNIFEMHTWIIVPPGLGCVITLPENYVVQDIRKPFVVMQVIVSILYMWVLLAYST